MASEPEVVSARTERSRLPVGKIAVAVAVIVALVVVIRLLPTDEWLRALQEYVRSLGAVGWVVYALVYALCCVLFVPASLLTLGAGAIFGLVEGTIVVVIGATLGAVASFLLARTVMRSRIEAMTASNPKFRALDRAIGKEGAKIVLLIRLAPVFPFTYINYAFGLTGVRTLPYTLATLFGIIPATFAFVYLGSSGAAAATGTTDTTRTIINIAGALLALLATIFVARVATRAIRRAGLDDAASDPASRADDASS
ncbi:MAG: TVP38/TMEM64 family protein [Thermoanaerobaculia bacterium]|jgi:uncharacterized membrane protein YdjX (TVP38/TMEM64 family)